METVDDIVRALHVKYPNDRYGEILIALMDYAHADNLPSVSFEDALYFYEHIADKKAEEIKLWTTRTTPKLKPRPKRLFGRLLSALWSGFH